MRGKAVIWARRCMYCSTQGINIVKDKGGSTAINCSQAMIITRRNLKGEQNYVMVTNNCTK